MLGAVKNPPMLFFAAGERGGRILRRGHDQTIISLAIGQFSGFSAHRPGRRYSRFIAAPKQSFVGSDIVERVLAIALLLRTIQDVEPGGSNSETSSTGMKNAGVCPLQLRDGSRLEQARRAEFATAQQ